MKLISWNVNGLRACLTHDFAASFAALDADIFSVQETKMQPGQADFAPEGYTEYTYSAEKKGYSGTACWCKTAPLAVTTRPSWSCSSLPMPVVTRRGGVLHQQAVPE